MFMPKGAAGCCTTKAVLVTVYVVRPTIARRNSSPQRRLFHNRNSQLFQNRHRIKQAAIHHQLHHYPNNKSISGGAVARRKGQGGGGNGYDRKAELLKYSHRLRESAKSTASTPVLLTSPTPLQIPTKSKPVGGDNTRRFSGFPTCFGKWEIFFNASFFNYSLTSFNRSKSIVRRKKNRKRRRLPGSTKLKTARVQKKCAALLSKLFSRIRLCR